MAVNWTALSLFIISFFVLIGFFRGWWKEAITTAFLAVLVFLLANPSLAASLIGGINKVIELVWGWIPDSLQQSIADLFAFDTVPQLDASSSTTWMMILIVMLALSIIVGRFSLSGHGYQVRPLGSIFGGLLGGLNGFILMGLVTAYLQGSSLPGGGSNLPTEITAQSGTATASSGVSIQAFNLPNITFGDSFLPYLIIIIGIAVLIMALKNRVNVVSKDGYRSVKARPPYGYRVYGNGKGGNGKG